MFEPGKDYWIVLQKKDGVDKIRGTLVAYEAPLLSLEIDGIQTVFSVASGSFLKAELCDEAAETARDKARSERYIQSFKT